MTRRVRACVAAILVILVALVVAYPAWKRARELNSRLICIGHVKGLATCFKLCRPDDVGDSTPSAKSAYAACEAECRNQTPHRPQGKADYILNPRLSHRDIGAGEVIAYEPLENHLTGGNVVYGDGHGEFVDAAEFARLMSEMNAEQN